MRMYLWPSSCIRAGKADPQSQHFGRELVSKPVRCHMAGAAGSLSYQLLHAVCKTCGFPVQIVAHICSLPLSTSDPAGQDVMETMARVSFHPKPGIFFSK